MMFFVTASTSTVPRFTFGVELTDGGVVMGSLTNSGLVQVRLASTRFRDCTGFPVSTTGGSETVSV